MMEFGVWSFHRHGLYIAHCVLMQASFSGAYAFQPGSPPEWGHFCLKLYPTGERERYLLFLGTQCYSFSTANARKLRPPEALGYITSCSPMEASGGFFL